MLVNLKALSCSHPEKTTVVLHSAVTVELTADKCQRCGKVLNKRIEV